MLLALGTAAVVLVVLLWELARPSSACACNGARAAAWLRKRARRSASTRVGYDPGRERRAEQRARELLRSCVDERRLGDVSRPRLSARVGRLGRARAARPGASYAYLIYPHRPIVAYVPQTGELLNEYCVAFPDHSRPYGSARLPDSDDVLAKWMALTADERG